MNIMFVGEAITRSRRVRNWNQGELAARVGVSQGHVSNIERGRSSDTAKTIEICDVLELDWQNRYLEALEVITSVEREISTAPELTAEHRRWLLWLYKQMVDTGPTGIAGP